LILELFHDAFSTAQVIQQQMEESMIVNDKSERMWTSVDISYFNILSQNFPERIEENYTKSVKVASLLAEI
jgi:hypothetical protein